MKILNKFTIQNLKLNRKRTIVTIIGIMLSSALICGVMGLVSSFQQTLINVEKREDGDYHVMFKNVADDKTKYIKENNIIEKYFVTKEIGWSYLEGSINNEKPYLHILSYNEDALNNYGINLTEGRLPENESEIIIGENINKSGRVGLKVGDTITLGVGKRISEDGTELGQTILSTEIVNETGKTLEESINITSNVTYKIVGIMEKPNTHVEEYGSPGFTAITRLEKEGGTLNIGARLKNPKNLEKDINKILDTIGKTIDDIQVNSELLRYEGFVGDNTLKVLYGIAAVVLAIIVASSVFVIRNSFSISVSEKNKQYGMMSSVGATAKQIRKSVLFEGFVIGLIAIPLGILLGVAAIVILLQVVNYLLADMLNEMKFIYALPIIPVLISIVISALTIYLSCLIPAIRASKISPIESIRGNNDIKIKAKKLKTNIFVKKIFGIGGVIASKNLKRSKKKYRTTVISIVISIVIFVSLSTFIECGNKTSSLYYSELNFNIVVLNGNEDIYKKLAKLDGVNKYAYYYETGADINIDKYATEIGKQSMKGLSGGTISVIAYNNEYFNKYINSLGLKNINYKTDAVLIDEFVVNHEDRTKSFEKLFNIKTSDEIVVKTQDKDRNIKIVANTDIRPMGLEKTFYTSGMLIVSKDFMENLEDMHLDCLYIYADNSVELENKIIDLIKSDLELSDVRVSNYDTYVEQQNRMVLVIAIFLYGFMTVISLIGVTNIFNTITTNMILRSKEFAMFKSIGMTGKEFSKMIRLESILYGVKSLAIGLPIGILGSYLIYKSFSESIDVGYSLPWKAMIISVVFVFLIVGLTMKYSLNRINKQNIIDTIRQDNI